jgi:FAD binding domain/Berberine and berberine like
MSVLTVGVSPEKVKELRSQLRGALLDAGSPEYSQARKLYNGMIDKRPALIARVVDTADVIASVHFARQNGMALAVRGGGHSGPGMGSVDDGLVIDLSEMRGIRVDPSNRTIRAEGGCVWGDVDHAGHAFGLTVPTGFVSSTGVGGLALGGGSGYLTRKYGLTIDNLLSVDMVLADGRFVTASERENADLFWAVRGGGGNFGVVTSFLFQGRPVDTVYGGPMFWSMEDAERVLKYWQNLILTAPDDLNGWFGFVTIPPVPMFPQEHHLKKMCVITWCYTGDLAKAEEVFRPIREFCPPVMDVAGPIPFPVLNSLFDALYPAGLQWYWKADLFNEISDKAIAIHLKYAAKLPTPHSTMHIYPINGAAHRVGKKDTAWNYRDASFSMVIVGVDPDPANQERLIQWAKDYWMALHPFSAGAAYLNFIMEEGEERVRMAYGENYARLAQIKAAYDPQNLFHVNQNIRPGQ